MFDENANKLLEQVMEDQSMLAEIVCLGDPKQQLAKLVELAEKQKTPVASDEMREYLSESLWT